MKNGSYFPNHETLIRTLWQMNQYKTLKTLANEKKIIRLIQFENAVQSLCVFKHTNTVRIAPKIKLFFQNFPHISIYHDLAATNHNSLVKKRDMEMSPPPILGKHKEQDCRKRNIFPKFQNKTKHKVDALVHYYCIK